MFDWHISCTLACFCWLKKEPVKHDWLVHFLQFHHTFCYLKKGASQTWLTGTFFTLTLYCFTTHFVTWKRSQSNMIDRPISFTLGCFCWLKKEPVKHDWLAHFLQFHHTFVTWKKKPVKHHWLALFSSPCYMNMYNTYWSFWWHKQCTSWLCLTGAFSVYISYR